MDSNSNFQKILIAVVILLIVGGIFYLVAVLPNIKPTTTTTPTSISSPIASLSLSPAKGTYKVGEEFPIEVLLNTDGAVIDGVDVVINYDKEVLEVVDKNPSKEGVQVAPSTLFPQYLSKKEGDVVNDKIMFSGLTEPGGKGFKNTSEQPVATITFKAKKAATKTKVRFEFKRGDTTDSNIVESGTSQDILAKVINGEYKINE